MIAGLKALFGAIILFLGRKLYWFTIAAVGFFAAIELTARLLEDQPLWVAIILGVIVGGIGALLAVTIQRIAIGLAGFFLGGFLFFQILSVFDIQLGGWNWAIFILGGLLGIALVSTLFEWTLILLSSIIGSILLVQSSLFPDLNRWILFLVTLILGLGVQVILYRSEKQRMVS